MGEQPRLVAFDIVRRLREHDIYAEFDHMDRSIKAQFKYANKLGAEYTAVIGEDELNKGVAKVKSMKEGVETEIALSEIIEYFTV